MVSAAYSSDEHNPPRTDEEPLWESRYIDWPLPATLSSNHLEASTVKALKQSISTQSPSYFQFVNKLLVSNHQGLTSSDAEAMTAMEQGFFQALKRGIPIKSSRPRCTAAANGTLLSLLECITSSNNTVSTTSTSTHSATNTTTSTHNNRSKPSHIFFYLVSRWNVRRDSHSLTILQTTSKIVHVFLDPMTGTHAFFSAKNGDFYYLHQHSKIPIKLMGFNDAAHYKAGKPYDAITIPSSKSTMSSHLLYPPDPSLAQLGLTPQSYVTAVAWNSTTNTTTNTTTTSIGSSNTTTTNTTNSISSGSSPMDSLTPLQSHPTNTVLLGTSLGEIYEYTLDPGILLQSSQESSSSSVHGIGGGDTTVLLSSTSSTTSSSSTPFEKLPILMTRLHDHPHHHGGLVSGMHYEISSSPIHPTTITTTAPTTSTSHQGDHIHMVLLAATSGMNNQTRLHTMTGSMTVYHPVDDTTDRIRLVSTTMALRHLFSSQSRPNDVSSAPIATTMPSSLPPMVTNYQRAFVELPGSIDYADLKVCHHDFALRTETGIYYGTLDLQPTPLSSSSSHHHPHHHQQQHYGSLSAHRTLLHKGTYNGIVSVGMIPYDESTTAVPISIAITPYHYVTMNEMNQVKFINRTAKRTIQIERIDATLHNASSSSTSLDDGIYGGGPGEILMDMRRPDQLWIRKSRSIIHISSKGEDRDEWKFHLEACLLDGNSPYKKHSGSGETTKFPPDAEFDYARSLCKNEAQKAVVTAARAEFYFSQGRMELAAKYLAQCPPTIAPFPETALRLALPSWIPGTTTWTNSSRSEKKYSQVRTSDSLPSSNLALISYLSEKMRSSKARNDSVACTMIGAWLTELYLHEREDIDISTSSTVKRATLQQFLSTNCYSMDAKTILDILCSHDVPASECLYFASSSGNIATAVNAALSISDYKNGALDALRVLRDAPLEKVEPFYYKHAFTLLSRIPMLAVQSFLARYKEGLSPTKLLPAIIRYERKRVQHAGKKSKNNSKASSREMDQIHTVESAGVSVGEVEVHIDQQESFIYDEEASIVYLQGCITLGCRSTAIFNYLVSLLVKSEDEDPLNEFLSKHITSKQRTPLDLPYTLRLILKSGRHFRSVIQLYVALGMRQRAVELAIKVDPITAKTLAKESIDPEEKKRFWLMIAKSAAEENIGEDEHAIVQRVLNTLKECGNVLSIEDVLPLLPDVTQMDQFKDEICAVLMEYSSKIESYVKDMNTCDQMCSTIREEIRRLSDYTMYMDGKAKCIFSETYVVNEKEPFYVFPSGLVALESALKNEVRPYLNSIQRERLDQLESEIQELKNQLKESGSSSSESKNDYRYRLDDLQAEIDGLIAAECPITGYIMIESIDKPFECHEDDVYIRNDFSLEA